MSWSAFKQIFDLLYLSQDYDRSGREENIRSTRIRTVRALDCLGHAEFDFGHDTARVYVAPAALVRLPVAGFPETLLAGARSPQTLEQIEQACALHSCTARVASQHQTVSLVSSRLTVQAENLASLEAVARMLKIPFESVPPAWALANLSIRLRDYLETRTWRQDGDLNWSRRDFYPETLAFGPFSKDEEVQLIRYLNPKYGIRRHVLKKNGLYAEIDCNWGRYAVLEHRHLNVLMYDERYHVLAVPASTPLPRLLARSLGLSSGYAPVWIPRGRASWASPEGWGCDVFREVPQGIAELVAACVGQALIPRPLGKEFLSR